jgi:hypothetical protein
MSVIKPYRGFILQLQCDTAINSPVTEACLALNLNDVKKCCTDVRITDQYSR